MDEIEIGIDPEKTKAGLEELNKAFKETATTIDKALGRDGNESMVKFEQAAEKGTNKVKSFFESMTKKVKEDMKTAFNITGIIEGAKFANEMQQGIRATFDMERAFSRLQVRLGLTNREFASLKTNMGSKIAGTGQKLEDVLPGVDVAASRGGVKSPEQLAAISEQLAKARGNTGEETGEMSEAVVEILKAQGKQITSTTFKEVLDALSGTRNSGAFKTNGEAGRAVEGLAPYGQRLGLGTRELGGLASAASGAGASGQDILQKLLQRGTEIGGAEQVNAAMGTSLFKKGKLDVNAFKDVKTDRFGQYSQQLMGDISGMTGANGGDLKRFLDSMKGGMKNFEAVTRGANETANQFGVASDNFATKLDKFKENLKNATREIGSGLSDAANAALGGHGGQAMDGLHRSAKGIWDNKGTLLGGGAATAAAGLLMGGGLNSLLKKIPGGGLLAKAAGAEAAKQAGVQPVYVVNASEFGAGGLPGVGGGTLGSMTKMGLYGVAAGAGVYAGSKASDWMHDHPDSAITQGVESGLAPIVKPLTMLLAALTTPKIVGMNPALQAGHQDMKDQIVRGIIEAHETVAEKMRPPLSNPSNPNPLQGGRR